MKRTVVITLEIDPSEYNDAEDTASGTIDLIIDCLRGEADFADIESTIECEGVKRHSKDHLE